MIQIAVISYWWSRLNFSIERSNSGHAFRNYIRRETFSRGEAQYVRSSFLRTSGSVADVRTLGDEVCIPLDLLVIISLIIKIRMHISSRRLQFTFQMFSFSHKLPILFFYSIISFPILLYSVNPLFYSFRVIYWRYRGYRSSLRLFTYACRNVRLRPTLFTLLSAGCTTLGKLSSDRSDCEKRARKGILA